MASEDEYQHRNTFEDKNIIAKKNGWVSITLPDGNIYTYNEKFWNEFLYGDVSKLISNK